MEQNTFDSLTKDQQLTELNERLTALEGKVPKSLLMSHRFWDRAFASLGYTLSIYFLILLVLALLKIALVAIERLAGAN